MVFLMCFMGLVLLTFFVIILIWSLGALVSLSSWICSFSLSINFERLFIESFSSKND